MKQQQSGMTDPTDVKIFILYLLDSINYPLDYSTIHDIIVQNGYVGQFDFADCFSRLQELGHVVADVQDGETYYMISPTGRMVAAELQSNLLLSIREKSLKSALRLLSFRKRQADCSCEITEREDHTYDLHCCITDPRGSLLDLTLGMGSRLQAEAIRTRFEKEPETFYKRLLSVLSGNADYALQ